MGRGRSKADEFGKSTEHGDRVEQRRLARNDGGRIGDLLERRERIRKAPGLVVRLSDEKCGVDGEPLPGDAVAFDAGVRLSRHRLGCTTECTKREFLVLYGDEVFHEIRTHVKDSPRSRQIEPKRVGRPLDDGRLPTEKLTILFSSFEITSAVTTHLFFSDVTVVPVGVSGIYKTLE